MAGGSSGPRLTSTRSNPYDRSFSAGLQIRFLAGPAAKESIGPLSGPQRVEHLKFVGGEKSFRQSFHVHIVADLRLANSKLSRNAYLCCCYDAGMRDLTILLVHFIATVFRLARPGVCGPSPLSPFL